MEQFEYGESVQVRNDGGQWVVRKYIGIKYFTRINTWDDEHQEWDEIRKLPERTATEADIIDIKLAGRPHPERPEAPEHGTLEYLQGQIHGIIKRLNIIESKLENQLK